MLGETPDQITRRYGAPFKSYRDVKGRIGHLYRVKEYQVMVQLLEGCSQSEVYTKENDEEITQAELDAIMSANSFGEKWESLPGAITKTHPGSAYQGWVILRSGALCAYGPSVINDKEFKHAVSVSTHAYVQHNKSSDLIRLQIEAENGSSEAQYELGKAYEMGTYAAPDYMAAARCYLAAAEQGGLEAQCNLGVVYAQGHVPGKNITDANYWFRRAAEAGYHQAQLNLAVSYLRGNGVKPDGALAIHWATKAAEQGYAIAQRQLGEVYTDGLAGPKDLIRGSFWFDKAAEQGDIDAMFLMGNLHFSLAKNLQTNDPAEWCHVGDAIYWYCRAANLGHEAAKEMKKKLKAAIPRTLFDHYESLESRGRN